MSQLNDNKVALNAEIKGFEQGRRKRRGHKKHFKPGERSCKCSSIIVIDKIRTEIVYMYMLYTQCAYCSHIVSSNVVNCVS